MTWFSVFNRDEMGGRRCGVGVLVLILSAVRVASAEPNDCGTGVYDEIYGWVGGSTTAVPSVGLRNSLGLVRDQCDESRSSTFELRIGGYLEGLKRKSRTGGELALGGELEVNWPLGDSGSRLGLHAGVGAGVAEPGQTMANFFGGGLRYRYDDLSAGIDVVHVTGLADPGRTNTGNETLVMIGGGVRLRGKGVLIALGVVAVVIVVGLAIAGGGN
jgi:hypothetical protein